MKTATVIDSRRNCFCGTCHFTIFKGEKIKFNGLAHHYDCPEALRDLEHTRKLNPRYVPIYGKVNRVKLIKALEARSL